MTKKNKHEESNDNPFIKIINQQHEEVDNKAFKFIQDCLAASECGNRFEKGKQVIELE